MEGEPRVDKISNQRIVACEKPLLVIAAVAGFSGVGGAT